MTLRHQDDHPLPGVRERQFDEARRPKPPVERLIVFTLVVVEQVAHATAPQNRAAGVIASFQPSRGLKRIEAWVAEEDDTVEELRTCDMSSERRRRLTIR